MALITWLLKPKYMLKHIFAFFVVGKYNMSFLSLRYLVVCIKTKIFFRFIIFCNILVKTRYFNTGFVSL
jgi:hypothetical protein